MRRYNLQSRDTCLALRWKSIGRRRRRKKEAQLLSWIRRNKEREMDGAKGKKSKKDCAGLSPGWTGQAVCYNVTLTGPTSDCSYSLLLLSFFFFLWIFFFSSSSPYSFKRKRGWSSSSSRLECCCLGRAPGVDVLHDNYTIVCVCVYRCCCWRRKKWQRNSKSQEGKRIVKKTATVGTDFHLPQRFQGPALDQKTFFFMYPSFNDLRPQASKEEEGKKTVFLPFWKEEKKKMKRWEQANETVVWTRWQKKTTATKGKLVNRKWNRGTCCWIF